MKWREVKRQIKGAVRVRVETSWGSVIGNPQNVEHVKETGSFCLRLNTGSGSLFDLPCPQIVKIEPVKERSPQRA
jgi:hypothetical protein